MISSLRGSVLFLDADSVVVDVNGVGFSVAVTPQHAQQLHVGDDVSLHTALIVRDDAFSLFGFAERDELVTFQHLISVSGVGPKSALGVLAQLTVDQIHDAVDADDDAPFRRVSGIGPKTAKLIVVQLTGKLAPRTRTTAPAASTRATGVAPQVVAALVALGWSERVAAETVAEVEPSAEAPTVASLLKLALAQLGPSRAERTERGEGAHV